MLLEVGRAVYVVALPGHRVRVLKKYRGEFLNRSGRNNHKADINSRCLVSERIDLAYVLCKDYSLFGEIRVCLVVVIVFREPRIIARNERVEVSKSSREV